MERNPSRRRFFSVGAASVAAAAVPAVALAAPDMTAASNTDDEVRALFRQWIAAAGEYDRANEAKEDNPPAADVMADIENKIMAMQGSAAFAAKVFFDMSETRGGWTDKTATLRVPDVFARHPEVSDWWVVALLTDAAAIIPEIAELAAPVLHPDAALIDAEIGIGWHRNQLANPRWMEWQTADFREERSRELENGLAELLDRVRTTEARTERGRAIKAALLAGRAAA